MKSAVLPLCYLLNSLVRNKELRIMKRTTLFLLLLLLVGTYAGAQNRFHEVVYLKNGSIIRGSIIEQVPDASLKIKTADGSIFVYPMTEVERITKETTPARQRYTPERSEFSLLRGYKGFVDAGYQFDLSGHQANSLEIVTSHGYQFNNYVFLGGGAGIIYYTDADKVMMPFFTNFRANLSNKPTTPFADMKVGYSAGDLPGPYLSLALGVRFAMQGKKALNLRLEYAVQNQGWDIDYSINSNHYYYDNSFTVSSLGLKLGFEF